ncbi:MAG: hypothetical protein QOI95_2071 [Acidimicrobiaceae bacterium]|jgi:carotenoid cleavage dioxygenase-like enzyme
MTHVSPYLSGNLAPVQQVTSNAVGATGSIPPKLDGRLVPNEANPAGPVSPCDTSDVVIVDAQDFASQPIATIRQPQRAAFGFHGSWMPDAERETDQ